MGQDWLIIDMDSRTKYTMGKLGESLFDVESDVRDMLRVRCLVPFSFDLKLEPGPPGHVENVSKGSILVLPIELIDNVFAFLGEYWIDLLCLSLTSRDLCNLGARHLHKFYERAYSHSLASGHRLLCLGDYTKAGDLPPGLILTAMEKNHLAGRGPQCLLRPLSTHGTILPREERPPKGYAKLVLRNLSRRAYVTRTRRRPSSTRSSRPHIMSIASPASLTPFSSASAGHPSASTATPYDGPLHRGIWAGDRFDIVSQDVFERRCAADAGNGEPWTDASEDVLAEIKAIWIAEGLFVDRLSEEAEESDELESAT
ncbi:hypothetical protein BD626DRAFT_487908 [Schizophyllum amplum]|uniref:Uncharacterized protein n=1 Tax=Schizophyllum amplum TaxID=97359 RepID=A0A550CK49_9AGAR|nr:hypothetical protein BD626DRAFT_487908 [Auriculariopsis ampla]